MSHSIWGAQGRLPEDELSGLSMEGRTAMSTFYLSLILTFRLLVLSTLAFVIKLSLKNQQVSLQKFYAFLSNSVYFTLPALPLQTLVLALRGLLG